MPSSEEIVEGLTRIANEWLATARRWGAGLILFGWLYPHFLEAQSIWVYTFASPIGLVPCPSLSVLIGLGLYSESFGSRAWGLTAGVLGLFYGIVGVARLGVWIDLPLVLGAAYITVSSARGPHRFRASSQRDAAKLLRPNP